MARSRLFAKFCEAGGRTYRRARAVLPALAVATATVALFLCASAASACSVPVFRYALERWPASPYEVIVFHRGPLALPQQALVARLSTNSAANLAVRTADLATNPAPALLDFWKRHEAHALPALVLRYPQGAAAQGEAWSGPLTEESVQRLPDSPARRRLVQRLLKGDCAVWVLLESGDKPADEAAATLLQTRLSHLEKTLKLPKLEAEDIANRVISVPEAELKVAFSLLRLSRADPAEEVFVRMLLGSEEDLAEAKGPLAFPVFGRGRALYALVGKGINEENIDEACTFLTGPCSCIVKEENPGVDLLLCANWDSLVRIHSTSEQEAPELTGLTAAPTVSPTTNASPGPAPLPAARGAVKLKASLLFAVVVGGLLLFGGMMVALRRTGRR